MKKMILFDFFGVISSPVYMQVFDQYIPKEEVSEWEAKLDPLDLGTLPEQELVEQIASKVSTTEKEVWNTVTNVPKINMELLDYISETLKKVYSVGMLTNVHTSILKRILSEKLSLFDPVFTSSDLGYVKPDPLIFEAVLNAVEFLPKNIIFVDDSPKNISVARTFGINGIVYKNNDTLIEQIEFATRHNNG